MLPTEEEWKFAKDQMAQWDEMKKASMKAGMKQFIKASPHVDNRETVLARGTDKDPFLEHWCIHQLRCKETTKKTSTSARWVIKRPRTQTSYG